MSLQSTALACPSSSPTSRWASRDRFLSLEESPIPPPTILFPIDDVFLSVDSEEDSEEDLEEPTIIPNLSYWEMMVFFLWEVLRLLRRLPSALLLVIGGTSEEELPFFFRTSRVYSMLLETSHLGELQSKGIPMVLVITARVLVGCVWTTVMAIALHYVSSRVSGESISQMDSPVTLSPSVPRNTVFPVFMLKLEEEEDM